MRSQTATLAARHPRVASVVTKHPRLALKATVLAVMIVLFLSAGGVETVAADGFSDGGGKGP